MTGSQNWRTETDASDYFGHQKKQVNLADRRPVIRKPADLVGPGIAPTAVRITSFDDVLATYNGFFSAEAGAISAPNGAEPFVGFVSSDSELGGVQLFTGLATEITYQRPFTRNPADASVVYFGAWVVIGTGGGGGGTGIVETIQEGPHIDVDSSDPANPEVSAFGFVEALVEGTGIDIDIDSTDPEHPIISAIGGVSPTAESYDDAVDAALAGVVHRWKWDETSGTNVDDIVGSLDLTMSGSYTRHVPSPTGFGTAMTAGMAESSGLGSIPVGNDARCFINVYRTNNDAAVQSLNSYGSQATRQWWDVDHRSQNCPALVVWGDDLVPTTWTPCTEEVRCAGTRDWHILAAGYDPTTSEIYVYRCGMLFTRLLGGVLATPSSGNFRVGTDTANGDQLSGAVDDVLVMNNWPGMAALNRLQAALAGVPHLH